MSAIILPSRRTRQPHWPVGIDLTNTLTRGLKSVLVPGLGYDPVIGGMAKYTDNGSTRAIFSKGKVLGFNVASRAVQGLILNWHGMASRLEGTILAWWIPTDVTGTSQHILTLAGANNRFYLRNNAGAFQYGWGVTANCSTTATWTQDRPAVAALSWLNSTGYAFFDGLQVGSATWTTVDEVCSASALGLSALYPTLDTSSARGYMIMAALWNRRLLPAEHWAIAQNPWRLLAPTKPQRYAISVSSPGGTLGPATFTAASSVGMGGKKNAKSATLFQAASSIQADGIREGGAVTVATAQAGNWSSTSTWVGGVVPGSGVLALINHNVTLDSGRTVGDGTDAFLIGNSATLTLDATLTCNGNATVGLNTGGSGTSWVGNLKFGPGSTLALNGFDLVLNVCRLSSTSTQTNWAKITGTASKIRTGQYVNPRQDFSLDNVSFQNTGTSVYAAASLPANAGVTSRLRFNHCVFAQPNTLQFGTAGYTPSETVVDVCYSDFRSNTLITFSGASSDTRIPLFEYNTVYSPTVCVAAFLTLLYRHTSFKGTVYIADLMSYGGYANFAGTFFAHPIGIKSAPQFASAMPAADGQTIGGIFCYADDTIANCHGFSYPSGGTIEDSFFEIYGWEPNILAWKAGATIQRNILKGRGVLASNTVDVTTALPMNVLNNTVHLQARSPEHPHKGLWLTENVDAGYVGTVNVRNNLCGFETEHDTAIYWSNRGSNSTALLTNVEKNAYYNNLETGTGLFNYVAVTNLDDLGTVAPAYVDSGRGLRPWVDMMLGQERGTATDEDAFTYMLDKVNGYDSATKTQNPNNVATGFAIAGTSTALLDWCRAGFAPTNTALKGTGIGGVDIGAVLVSSTGTSSGVATFTGVSSVGMGGKKQAAVALSFPTTSTLAAAARKHAFSFAYGEGTVWDESGTWDESEPWDESGSWGGLSYFLVSPTLGLGGIKTSKGEAAASAASSFLTAGKKNTLSSFVLSHVSALALFSSQDTGIREGAAAFLAASGLGMAGIKEAFGEGTMSNPAAIWAGFTSVFRIFYGEMFLQTGTDLGFGGRKTFSYSLIGEADVATITQGQRVLVEFTQGESVERNVFFFMPNGVTPIADLSTYSARMELRENPDDPTPLATLVSGADGDIFLSDTGLIVWEIPGSVTRAFEATGFGGDLFVYAPDGDAIKVCGFDFEMELSYTKEA